MPSLPSLVVILNADAGSAQGPHFGDELRELFLAAGWTAEIVTLNGSEDPTTVARRASARVSVVVAGGGDGTVGSVAAGLVGSAAALGVLPLGTLNHFAKDLGIPLDLHQAVATVAARHVRQVDVGRVNDRVFINNSSIGLYPGIVQEREELRRRGHRKWPAMAIATARAVWGYRGMAVGVDSDDVVRNRRTPFVFVGNNAYATEGMRVGARAHLDQGMLFVGLAPRVRTRDLPLLVLKALLGRESGAFEIIHTAALTIRTRPARPIAVALDGEITTLQTPLEYRLDAKALAVVVPHP